MQDLIFPQTHTHRIRSAKLSQAVHNLQVVGIREENTASLHVQEVFVFANTGMCCFAA